ncbi:MAG: DUF4446 family protein [Chloroflexota bacterium]|nr:DUF4446 family protein [Chloroflexota bacterium]
MPNEVVAPIAVAALAVALLSLLLSLFLGLRRRRAPGDDRLRGLMDEAVDRLLAEQIGRVDALSESVAEQAARLQAFEGQSRRAVQRVGLVRYNPFDDTGSNQSFALALVDGRDDGVVLSSLHSRQVTRVYLKQIIAGRSETALSEEETEALRRARGG